MIIRLALAHLAQTLGISLAASLRLLVVSGWQGKWGADS
jgi:hypothetical protein